MQKVIAKLETEQSEFKTFKINLKAEKEQEDQLIQDITYIVNKYKKLLADHRKDKEKLTAQVNNQRKVLTNLKKRRDYLADDSNKLFYNFRTTITNDEQRGVELKKQYHTRKQEQEILEC